MKKNKKNFKSPHPAFSHLLRPEKVKMGFTLAEVLITMAIIGVVAAMTIPTLVQNYKDRQYKIQSTNFQRKFGEALKIMDTQSNLQGFSSTEQFVTELQKQMKITKVCTTKPSDCFETSVKLADGTTFDASNVKTSTDLGHTDYATNVVGLQFADGVTALVAYNPKYSNNDPTQTVKFSYKQDGKLSLVNLSTGVLSIIFDTTGAEKPNQVGTDIIGMNAMLGGVNSSDEPVQVGSYMVLDLGNGYKSIPCIESTGINSEYCATWSGSANDNWAGAQKTCAEKGMKVPTISDLDAIYAYLTQEESSGITLSGRYWSSTQYNAGNGYSAIFGDGSYSRSIWDKPRTAKAMCIQ